MYIEYRNEDEVTLLHLPETAVWELHCGWLEDDYCLYLLVGDEVIEISSMDDMEFFQLPMNELAALYQGVAAEVIRKIRENPALSWISIDEIERNLLTQFRNREDGS